MKNTTRLAIEAYIGQIAALNHIPASAVQSFTVDPSVAQTIESKIQESSAFLGRINMVTVSDQMGEKIGLGVGGPIAGTTNTTTTDRVPTDPSTLDKVGYLCTQTNFDTLLKYAKLDLWAKFPNFQTLIRDAILTRQALDRILIGWNGASRAATSNKVTNPKLQDVNIGWIEKCRVNKAASVMTEGATAGELRIGDAAGNDYHNLDALVMDMVSSLIAPWHQENPGLVAIVGRNLMHDKYFPLVNKAQDNSEKIAADLIISQKRIGGLPGVSVPGFPEDGVAVTSLDNLSIYVQEGSRRRTFIDNPKRDQYENYESVNEAYVVEDHDLMAVAENIVFDWA